MLDRKAKPMKKKKFRTVIRIERSKYVTYTIYKLRVHATKQYYIGVTSNFIQRKKNHKDRIFNLVHLIRCNQQDIKCALPCYITIAKVLAETSSEKLSRTCMEGISFQVLGTTKFTDEAKAMEDLYLTKAAKDPLCLNAGKRSTYNKRIFISKK